MPHFSPSPHGRIKDLPDYSYDDVDYETMLDVAKGRRFKGSLIAMDFPTQDAYDKYMDEHPAADKSNHHIVETKKEPTKKEETPKQEKPKQVQKYLVGEGEYGSYKEFIDAQSVGDCQEIASDIAREFGGTIVKGDLKTDEEYTDEDGRKQKKIIHHWVEIDGVPYDFAKGSLKGYVSFDDIYSPELSSDDLEKYPKRKSKMGRLADKSKHTVKKSEKQPEGSDKERKYEPAPLPKDFHKTLHQIFDKAKAIVPKDADDLVKQLNRELKKFKITVVKDEDMATSGWANNIFSVGNAQPNGGVELTINNKTVKAFKDKDTDAIEDSLKMLLGHEFSHVEQFSGKPKSEEMRRLRDDPTYWEPLEKAANTKNQKQFAQRMQDMFFHIEDGKPEPKWVKKEGLDVEKIKKQMQDKYFFNESEFPSYALSVVLEMATDSKGESEKEIRKKIDGLTVDNYKKYATKGSILQRYSAWKMPDDKIESLLSLAKQTAKGLHSSYFERWGKGREASIVARIAMQMVRPWTDANGNPVEPDKMQIQPLRARRDYGEIEGEIAMRMKEASDGKAIAFKPPEKVENPDNLPSVFLAGAIDQGKSWNWQADITEYLNDVPCVILNPRRDDWDASWVQSIDNDDFRGQVEWELDGMEMATVVAMCLPLGSTAPISLLELGLHASDGKMLVFCPEGFYRKGNVEVVCKRYGVTVYDQFDEFKAAVKVRLSHSKAKTAAADSKTHKNFSNKRDALKFLNDHALMSVGWPEGQGGKEACYWNGKLHITKADIETKVARREMLRVFVTGARYQNKPHFEIPQFPIQGKMELQSYQKKVTCHICGQEMITRDPRRYPSHKDKNGEMCKESGWKIPQYPTQNSRISAKTYWHGSDNPDVTIFKTDPEMFSLLGEGVYFYKNKFSAQGKGQYLYRVVVPPSLKIAPLNYRFSDDDVSMIFSRLLIQEKPGRYMGESSFLWWATDGYNLYPMSSHFNRTNLVKLLRSFMLSKGFSGMLANYPNGGEVLVLWDGYQGLRPENVETRQGASMNIAQELVKVAREVTSDNTGLALDGMSNIKARRVVNKILEPLTKGFFTDTYWEPVQAIWTALSKANINYTLNKAEYTRDNRGESNGKLWRFDVQFTNDKGRHTILYGTIQAAWAGSVADPSDRYDLVAYVS